MLPDGSGRLQSRIPRADISVSFEQEKARFSYADGRFQWWANGKESVPPQADLSKVPLIGTPLVCTMAPDGRVSDVTLADPRVMADLARALPNFDPARLTSMAGQPVFPAAPMKVGESWASSGQVAPLGPSFPFSYGISRTLDSFEERAGIGLARISGFAETRYQGAPNMTLPGQDVSIGITEIRQTIGSTEFFNATSGRLIRGDYDLAFSTRISAQAGGQQKGGGLEARIRINLQAR